MEDKKQIRRLIRELKKQLTPEMIEEKSSRVAQHLSKFLYGLSRDCRTIGVYLSLPDELQTKYLISELETSFPQLTILVPRVLEDNEHILFFKYIPDGPHTISNYGIWEPVADESEAVVPDILIMPGIAFDAKGGRVGHGGGFYDRYLQDNSDEIKHTIAIAYSLQVLDSVPMERFDIPVEVIVTEDGVVEIKG